MIRLPLFAVALVGTAFGQRVGLPTDDLDKLTPDELFNVEVTSVGRKAQQIAKAPAAVFVLTAEDIRRCGATSIPEALQWVPGLTVLRVDGRSWIVSARGGARLYANQMLVMVDGRSLYTPLFSGVAWDAVDVAMDDIERIEVVRGPGAVMWGPNAVNGVINIITKSSTATKGGQAAVAAGDELRNSTAVRWGGSAGDRVSYRAWGRFEYRAPAFDSQGTFLIDNYLPWRVPDIHNLDMGMGSAGFRFDGHSGAKDQWTVEGDTYRIDEQDPLVYALSATSFQQAQGHGDFQGGSILGRWTHTSSPDSESVLQFSYYKADLNYPYVAGGLDNLTAEFQRRWKTGERNEIYWSVGYQRYTDRISEGREVTFSPAESDYDDSNLVLRDEFQLLPARLTASLGFRLDYSNYCHLQYQPSFHLLYTPNNRHSAWIGVSRAVRLPSRQDRNIAIEGSPTLYNGIPFQPIVSGGGDSLAAEAERSLEAGYRLQSGQRWSVDVSGFWSYYKDLIALEGPATPQLSFVGGAPRLTSRLTYDNAGAARSYGGEVWATWRVFGGWKLMPSYSYLHENRWLPYPATVAQYWDAPFLTVPHQFRLRSEHDLSRNWRLDLMARASSRDPQWQLGGGWILDARLGWLPTRSTELSVAVQDLTGRTVYESYPELQTLSIPLRRTFTVRWSQRF